MTPKTKFNAWILTKIKTYLEEREGCEVEPIDFTYEGARTIIQDSFGYRYEVEIRTLGRIQNDTDGEFEGLKKISSFLSTKIDKGGFYEN